MSLLCRRIWPRLPAKNRRVVRRAGFTLIELMVIMVIVGILTAIAIPSYTAYIQRSNRSDARTQMLIVAQWMERFRNENSTYVGAAIPINLQCSPANATGAGTCRNYTLTLAGITAATYSVQATPVAGSPMAGDVCGVLSVTGAGVRAPATDLCWGR
jgi:type IV pilus assembly protein PilE